MPILLSQFNSPSSSPILCPYVHPLCLCLYFCPINRFVCTIFLTSALCVNTRCLCLSFWLHSVWHSRGPSTSLQVIQLCSFSWLSNIPLYFCFSSLSPIYAKIVQFHISQKEWNTIFLPYFGTMYSYKVHHVNKEHNKSLHIYLNTLQRNWLKKKPLIQIWFCQKFWWVYILNFPLCYLHIHFILIGSIRIFTSKSLRKTDALSFIKRLQSSSAFICCVF